MFDFTMPCRHDLDKRADGTCATRCTCLINNFNYRDYIVEAVESALAQTRPFDEIIVIDDGSTDDSLDLLRRHFSEEPTVRIIAKANAGQLSCFNAGFEESNGDLVFFLDADDRYRPTYVEEAIDFLHQHPDCSFLFCDYTVFGLRNVVTRWGSCSHVLGFDLVQTLIGKTWTGAPTSCLVLRRSLASKFLPLPLEDDWRIRADDCLVYGASLVGAKKGYLCRPLVDYRAHGTNQYLNRRVDRDKQFLHLVAKQRLFQRFMKVRGLNPEDLSRLATLEFRTHKHVNYKLYRQYVRLVRRSNLPFTRRFKSLLSMSAHYIRTRARKSAMSTNSGSAGPHAPVLALPASDLSDLIAA